jgi:integrase
LLEIPVISRYLTFSGNFFQSLFGGEMVVKIGNQGKKPKKIKFTKRAIDGLVPSEKPETVWDGILPGFGVQVMPSGLKTFVLHYRPGAGGRAVGKQRYTIGRYGPMTVEQARKAAQDALARIRLGEDPQAEKGRQRAALTVDGLIAAFLETHGAKLKPKTRAHYAGTLAALAAAHGSLKAEALTRAQVAALHHSMAATPYQGNRMLAAVSKLHAWAEDHGYLPEGHPNPAQRVKRYKEQGRERFLSSEELAQLGDALREAETLGLPWRGEYESKHTAKEENRRTVLDPFSVAAIRLLILTGARLREILNAKWEQVDFERGILFLADSKTGRKPIYLSAAALAVLADLPRIEGNPHIIPGTREGQGRFDLRKPWATVTRAAGLYGLRIHDLRHTNASIGAGAGLSLPVIGRLLGHSQAATTQRYSHLAADPVRQAAERVGSIISAALEGRRPGAPALLRRR